MKFVELTEVKLFRDGQCTTNNMFATDYFFGLRYCINCAFYDVRFKNSLSILTVGFDYFTTNEIINTS
jgi:hypothetical protein